MKIIYKPRGAALEYAPWAANLYTGCAGRCAYCYAPAVLRMTRDDFARARQRRFSIIDGLIADMRTPTFRGIVRRNEPILLSFACDPFQPIDKVCGLTVRAVRLLRAAGAHVRLLTKFAPPDEAWWTLAGYGVIVEYGASLVWSNDADRKRWEPGTASIGERMDALRIARCHGLRTWVSVEPIIDPAQALDVVRACRPFVDRFAFGMPSRVRTGAQPTDWRKFVLSVVDILNNTPCGWYFKDSLWRASGGMEGTGIAQRMGWMGYF